MSKSQEVKFPKKFLWGAASSAHQYEGGLHNQWTVFELENAKSLAAQSSYLYGELASWPQIREQAKRPETYISGRANGHRELYRKDFDLLKIMNMNSWRFSIEWSRVEPEQGAWNAEAIQYYKDYIAELQARGIEPVVTLFHFTLPVWFVEMGGFEKRRNIDYFVGFAEKMLTEVCPKVRYIITINEPEVYVSEGYIAGEWPPQKMNKKVAHRVLCNLARAHNLVADIAHKKSRRHQISVAKNSIFFYPGDDAWLSIKSAQVLQYIYDDYFLKKVRRRCDFLGVNYYVSNRVYGYRIHNPNDSVSDLGRDLAPEHLQHTLERLAEKYDLPVLITENGLADMDDEKRKWWLAETIVAMQKAMKNDVTVLGYMHWSLLDNFEWSRGRWPRSGLFSVDYDTLRRKPRPSAIWLSRVIRKLRG